MSQITLGSASAATVTPRYSCRRSVAGVGLGFVVVPLVDIVLTAVPEHLASGASGIFSTAQQFGGALGVTTTSGPGIGARPKGATPPGDGPSWHQVVGGVAAHQADDAYRACERGPAHWD